MLKMNNMPKKKDYYVVRGRGGKCLLVYNYQQRLFLSQPFFKCYRILLKNYIKKFGRKKKQLVVDNHDDQNHHFR